MQGCVSMVGRAVRVEIHGQVLTGTVVRQTWAESVGEMVVIEINSNSTPMHRVNVSPADILEIAA